MFKDSNVTSITPWTVIEESEAMPWVNYPALIGTGLVGVGLDAAGLQSLPDTLTTYFKCDAAPFHNTQCDLYVLHEGMISEHLWQSEVKHTGRDLKEGEYCYGLKRNLMPLGYITQSSKPADKQLLKSQHFVGVIRVEYNSIERLSS